MDPDACLKRWRDALANNKGKEAEEAREDLLTWLRAGGFEPKWGRGERANFMRLL